MGFGAAGAAVAGGLDGAADLDPERGPQGGGDFHCLIAVGLDL